MIAMTDQTSSLQTTIDKPEPDVARPLDTVAAATPPPSPRDPKALESALRLGSVLPDVTRLSRKAIIGMAAGLAVTVGAGVMVALMIRQGGAPVLELYATDQKPSAEAMSALPADYANIPKLGPALMGDLGKPMLDAQRRYPLPPPERAGGQERFAQVDPELARLAQARDAARGAGVFVGGQNRGGSQSEAASPVVGGEQLPAVPATPVAPTPPDPKRAFLDAPTDHRTASTARLEPSVSPYMLQSGSIIAAALITGIRSDLPGQITAQVTENVYDSVSGVHLLIPQGSRLIGTYDAQVQFGQQRALLVWNRLILPNGHSLVLDRQPGTDAQGFAGLEDSTNFHWGKLVLAAGVSSILSLGTGAGSSSNSDIARAIRQSTADTIGRTGDEIVRRQLSVAPTLTIRPGFPLRVLINRDLILEPLTE